MAERVNPKSNIKLDRFRSWPEVPRVSTHTVRVVWMIIYIKMYYWCHISICLKNV